MIPPLVLSPKLQRRQREAALNPRGPLPNGGLTGDVGSRPPQAFRASGEDLELPAVTRFPIRHGWSEVGGTLFFRFDTAPPSIWEWAVGDEKVAQRPKRKTGFPRYMVAVVPNSVSLFQYGGEMEELEGLNIGVCREDNPRLRQVRRPA